MSHDDDANLTKNLQERRRVQMQRKDSIGLLPSLQPWPSYFELPNLPVPPLNKTLAKLRGFVSLLVSEKEYAEFECKLKNFENGSKSKKIQESLETKAKTEDNWLAEW